MNDKTTTSTPEQIRRRVLHAQSGLIAGVAIALGRWQGLGDWAGGTAEGKRRAGLRALTELDQVIADLTVARDDLNAALAAHADLPAEG